MSSRRENIDGANVLFRSHFLGNILCALTPVCSLFLCFKKVIFVKKVSNFFYTLMLTVLIALATFLLLLLIFGIVDTEKFRYFTLEFFPREVVFGFFALIVFIVLAFLVYNTVRVIVNIVKRRGRGVVECLLTGVSMTAGVSVLIHFLLSDFFSQVVADLTGGLLC